MSLASSGVAFRLQRASTLRNVNADEYDAGGQPLAPDWQPYLTGVPCRICKNPVVVEPADAAKAYVMEDRRAMVPLGTDVTEQDQLGDITDPVGNVLYAGPMNITGVVIYADHLELNLEALR